MTLSMAMADMEREDMMTKIAFKKYFNLWCVEFSTNLNGVLKVTKKRRVSPVPSLVNHLHLVIKW